MVKITNITVKVDYNEEITVEEHLDNLADIVSQLEDLQTEPTEEPEAKKAPAKKSNSKTKEPAKSTSKKAKTEKAEPKKADSKKAKPEPKKAEKAKPASKKSEPKKAKKEEEKFDDDEFFSDGEEEINVGDEVLFIIDEEEHEGKVSKINEKEETIEVKVGKKKFTVPQDDVVLLEDDDEEDDEDEIELKVGDRVKSLLEDDEDVWYAGTVQKGGKIKFDDGDILPADDKTIASVELLEKGEKVDKKTGVVTVK